MEPNSVVAPTPTPTSAIPSSTFSTNVVNAVLGMFLESAATIEDIANQNNLSIPTVMQCLQEQTAFLQGMLSTLDLRVRLLASRAEAVAIETLRDIATFARDQEARRKAASKLLSHFKRAPAPSPRRAIKVGSATLMHPQEPQPFAPTCPVTSPAACPATC